MLGESAMVYKDSVSFKDKFLLEINPVVNCDFFNIFRETRCQ